MNEIEPELFEVPGIRSRPPDESGVPVRVQVPVVYVLVTISRVWRQRYDPELKAMTSVLGIYRALHPGATLLHGDCPDGDRDAAAIWARWGLPTWPVPVTDADWARFGRAAGPRRNARMVAMRPVVCVALIADRSRGASGCAELAERAGVPTQRYRGEELPGPMPVCPPPGE